MERVLVIIKCAVPGGGGGGGGGGVGLAVWTPLHLPSPLSKETNESCICKWLLLSLSVSLHGCVSVLFELEVIPVQLQITFTTVY